MDSTQVRRSGPGAARLVPMGTSATGGSRGMKRLRRHGRRRWDVSGTWRRQSATGRCRECRATPAGAGRRGPAERVGEVARGRR
ncbi:hypothetical protein IPC618_23380 [Pseudomonas aeruginosa]|nr:hypothetical protein HW04_30840 [Pseudomonas aeruginosa]QDL65177.1 hypothetical protein EIP97_16700 [Pseudomonas aeruginosa UCBPP-PA14]ARH14207.1 hypothetical protein HW02_33395 [Pseudomonas aeruginosa]ARH14490.1 hypothetical protein HW01_32425 [Pseudomonas aeruginosa]ASD10754.1 hypothetical protein CD800_17315 [Pseudomonas aeruginosa]